MYSSAPLPFAAQLSGPSRHMLSVDVEDYFHVNAFAGRITPEHWTSFESRVVANTERLLDLFAEHNTLGTFFMLGWVAERHPALVQRIVREGHEIASHSYWHRLVYSLTPDTFRDDLRRSRDVIEAASGVRVRGFRAPSWSITLEAQWAFDVLIEEGFEYDASVFPIRHDVYGIPSAPRVPHVITRPSGSIIEVPGTAGRWTSFTVPIGGGYFRLLPYRTTRLAIARYSRVEGYPAMFYLHPWEIDAAQPRIAANFTSRIRHYTNLVNTEGRLRRLLQDFSWGPVASTLFPRAPGVAPAAAVSPFASPAFASAEGPHDHRRV